MSTTVDAAGYDLPYVICIDNGTSQFVYLSSSPARVTSTSKNNTGTSTSNIETIAIEPTASVVQLVYNTSFAQWQTRKILSTSSFTSALYILGTSTMITSSSGSSGGDVGGSGSSADYKAFSLYGTYSGSSLSVITNASWNSTEKSWVGSYSNDLTQLPQGLTEDVIRDIINEQLNTQTAAGQTAQTVINNTTNQYNLYLSGDIDSETMQQNVTSNIDTLSDLTPSTLLDAMQINNGLTYNQTIQDQLLNTASGNVQSMINGYQNTINDAITNYQNGTTSQKDTVNIINQAITNLNNMIINGTAKTTADVNAVNAAINAANANLDSVTGYKDLSKDSSEKAQQSDQAELDYLEELTAETTSTVEQLAPSKNFTSGQTGEAQEVLDLIWENEFVKRLLPMCAGFMVVCVVLGIRYKV